MTKQSTAIVTKRWLGAASPHFYPTLGATLVRGDVVEIPTSVFELDPDRWGDPLPEGDGAANKGSDA